jgi:biopolymer transport protein ExbD
MLDTPRRVLAPLVLALWAAGGCRSSSDAPMVAQQTEREIAAAEPACELAALESLAARLASLDRERAAVEAAEGFAAACHDAPSPWIGSWLRSEAARPFWEPSDGEHDDPLESPHPALAWDEAERTTLQDLLAKACPSAKDRLPDLLAETDDQTWPRAFHACRFDRYRVLEANEIATLSPFGTGLPWALHAWMLEQGLGVTEARAITRALLDLEHKGNPRLPVALPAQTGADAWQPSPGGASGPFVLAPDFASHLDENRTILPLKNGVSLHARAGTWNAAIAGGQRRELVDEAAAKEEYGFVLAADATIPWTSVSNALNAAVVANYRKARLLVRRPCCFGYGALPLELLGGDIPGPALIVGLGQAAVELVVRDGPTELMRRSISRPSTGTLDRAALLATLEEILAAEPQPRALALAADGELPYASVIEVLAILHQLRDSNTKDDALDAVFVGTNTAGLCAGDDPGWTVGLPSDPACFIAGEGPARRRSPVRVWDGRWTIERLHSRTPEPDDRRSRATRRDPSSIAPGDVLRLPGEPMGRRCHAAEGRSPRCVFAVDLEPGVRCSVGRDGRSFGCVQSWSRSASFLEELLAREGQRVEDVHVLPDE